MVRMILRYYVWLLMAMVMLMGCAAIERAYQKQQEELRQQEAPMMAEYSKDDGYKDDLYDTLAMRTAAGIHDLGKVKFCSRAKRGTGIRQSHLDQLQAQRLLDPSRHYFWIDDRDPLLSVPFSDATAFEEAAKAGRVCLWVNGAQAHNLGPAIHVPVDKWDGVTRPHPDYKPEPPKSEGGAP